MARRIDTRSLGLDIGVGFIRWLTGAENLHYGLWSGLEVNAGNLGRAQAAYTDRLFDYLPPGRLRILDIGGGAGETARRLTGLGHAVEVVVPSSSLARRCRENAPEAMIHETRFEDFAGAGSFDLCLFSESFQYIRPDVALGKAVSLLAAGGEILIADCFRSDAFSGATEMRVVGGGHRLAEARRRIAAAGLVVVAEEDVTAAVAPSVEVEQEFYLVLGQAVRRVDAELRSKRPWLRRSLHLVLKLGVGARRRRRLAHRLFERDRTAEAFCKANRYLILRLRPEA